MNSIVEKEKSKTLKFAEKYGLSEAMVETEIENMYNSLKPDALQKEDRRHDSVRFFQYPKKTAAKTA